ncbi:uncharacterized protein DS421_8g233850 [Arachis hypogaea]|nr:uncharacterized protein DS421_8g233850 [Arachis hypogaea]
MMQDEAGITKLGLIEAIYGLEGWPSSYNVLVFCLVLVVTFHQNQIPHAALPLIPLYSSIILFVFNCLI